MATATPIATAFVNAITAKLAPDAPRHEGTQCTGYDVMPGKVYDKIVTTRDGRPSSAYAFIERSSGKLIKSGSWKAPQRNVDGLAYRFDLSTPEGMAEAIAAADRFGSFMYQR